MATHIIELEGGTHNAPPIRVRVASSLVIRYGLGHIEFDDMLSPYQRRLLEKHFCGIKDCQCGSYHNANTTIF